VPQPGPPGLPPLALTRLRRGLLTLVVLFLGGSGLIYEYCLSTLATHLVGNSIEQFSVIIGLMLFAMGLAGLAQRHLRDPTAIADIFVLVETGLAVIGGASALALYLAFAHLDHFRFVLYLLALVIGFGIGLEIPLLLRINERWRTDLRENVGEILSLDYMGALLGALLWAFVLLPTMALDRISLLLGLANLGAALVTLLMFWPWIRNRVLVVGALIGSFACLGGLAALGPKLVVDARQRLFAYPIRHHVQSAYQDIVITGSGQRLSMYLNGHLQFDSEDEYIYHELLVHPALSALERPPRNVLVLGGGDGLAVREILRWPSVRRVLLVDLDPAVTTIAATYGPLVRLNEGVLADERVEVRHSGAVKPGGEVAVTKRAELSRDALRGVEETTARVQVMNLDADAYVRDFEGRFDAIICDFPDPSAPDLAKLFSVEFYGVLHRRLAPGGVVVLQAGSPYTMRAAFWSVRDTLEAAGFAVVSLHANVPTFGEWGWHVGRAGAAPQFGSRPQMSLRYLTDGVLAAAQTFPPPMARPAGPPRISTRLDPWVMRLYERGEPLTGPRLFNQTAER